MSNALTRVLELVTVMTTLIGLSPGEGNEDFLKFLLGAPPTGRGSDLSRRALLTGARRKGSAYWTPARGRATLNGIVEMKRRSLMPGTIGSLGADPPGRHLWCSVSPTAGVSG
ncbi:hypothetical protein B0H19DRAFT_1084412 [Mycena capillaripes]|nr:hypothetical protein B0H19DRAFT_1084412 [Mycena capillaripes]